MTEVFAIGRGQYENIGDIILRRQLLDWVRPHGHLHVYLGHAPDGYADGLGLAAADRVYSSFRAWYLAALQAAWRGGAVYLFKPGEIQLTLIGMKEHLSMLPLLLVLRARGGKAIRVGVGSRNFAPLPRALMRPSIALSDLSRWRDVVTAEYLRAGSAMPDLAFGEGADDATLAAAGADGGGRDALVVSMRSDLYDRAYPERAWIDGVRAFAERRGLQIWAVTQVQVDDERTRRLADDLGGQALTWPTVADHGAQEERLRALYRRTAVVMSDRLHVVIAGFTEGAVPVGSLVDDSDKIDRHFRTIGIDGITITTGALDAAGIADALADIEARRRELFAALLDARDDLREVQREVVQLVAPAQLTIAVGTP